MTSLSQRDLSQDDENSTTSGLSSVDLPSVDDGERLTMLASAVKWIKEELVSLSTSNIITLWFLMIKDERCILAAKGWNII